MLNDPWQLLLAFGAVAVLSFVLGARWMKRALASRLATTAVLPGTAPDPARGADVSEALDRIHSELNELAERQEFAERLLMQRKPGAAISRNGSAAG